MRPLLVSALRVPAPGNRRALDRHLADQSRHQNALNRGGGTRVPAFDAMRAEELDTLESLDHRDPVHLSGTRITKEGIKRFLRALPGCRVIQ